MLKYPLFYLGALASYVIHPQTWLVAGPFRMAALLWATVSQESGWNPDAYANETGSAGTGSAGLAQFQPGTWEDLAPDGWTVYDGQQKAEDARFSPAKVGYISIAYVAAAITSDFSWLAIRLPGYGLPLMRLLWRGGIGAFERAGSLEKAKAEGDAYVASEGRTAEAYTMANRVAMIATAVVLVAIGAIAYKRRRR